MQTMNTPEEELSLLLAAGTYSVYALTGADSNTYLLPTKTTAKPDVAISLLNPEKTHSELEAGRATITLKENEEIDLTLTVNRIVAQVAAEITGVPNNVNAVTVLIEPLHTEVKLNGTYGTEATGQVSFPLIRENNGTWKTSNPVFILPGQYNATVTIVLTDALETHRYVYSSNVKVEANYQIPITAHYSGSSDSDLNSQIISTDWKGTRDISFNFGPEGVKGNDDTQPVTNLPVVGDLYKGCYVLAVTDITANSGNLLLVAPQQWENLTIETVDQTIAGYMVNEITGWKLPNRSQAEILFKAGTKVPGMDRSLDYLFQDGEKMRWFSLSESNFNPSLAYTKTPYSVRVTKVLNVIVE